jgi:hypothetical protein
MIVFMMVIIVWNGPYHQDPFQMSIPDKTYSEEECRAIAPVVQKIIEGDTGYKARVSCIPTVK